MLGVCGEGWNGWSGWWERGWDEVGGRVCPGGLWEGILNNEGISLGHVPGVDDTQFGSRDLIDVGDPN